MKYLTLIRHAKAGWGDAESDFDRELTSRGVEDAGTMASILADRLAAPERIVSSSATRARQTIETIASCWPAGRGQLPQISLSDELYLAEVETIIDFVADSFDNAGDTWVCGHNPGISAAVDALLGSPGDSLPTLGVVRLEFADGYGPGRARLLFRDTPAPYRR